MDLDYFKRRITEYYSVKELNSENAFSELDDLNRCFCLTGSVQYR